MAVLTSDVGSVELTEKSANESQVALLLTSRILMLVKTPFTDSQEKDTKKLRTSISECVTRR